MKSLFLLLIAILTISVSAVPAEPPKQHPGGSGSPDRGVGTIKVCGAGKEQHGALCYDKCPDTHYRVALSCWEKCRSDEINHPATCFKSIISWRWKHMYTLHGSLPEACPSDRVLEDGLCYKPCKPDHKGIGTLCHYTGK
ncbi:hypothetical protein BKA69DRAFT_1127092 [Paraphysoderma sedebokerense]|nr:hypothetical protein BKA69DRAFT_1127092 [Paraphysoderma sedebokerense]